MKSFALVALYILYGAGDFFYVENHNQQNASSNVINMEINNLRLYNEDRKYVASTFRGVDLT